MLLFALAEKLGIWDVDALAEQMPGELLKEWRVYLELKDDVERAAAQRTSRPEPEPGRA